MQNYKLPVPVSSGGVGFFLRVLVCRCRKIISRTCSQAHFETHAPDLFHLDVFVFVDDVNAVDGSWRSSRE